MNAAILVLFGVVWLIFAYFWYGGVIRRKLFDPIDKKETPSHALRDGQDYVPSKPFILFGHHFSSIAGAGPIIGPLLAFSLFGWVPALLWITLGSVFMGAVHDYTALIVSVRNKGRSIVEISEKLLSPKAMVIFGVFVWLTLVFLIAVFADLTAETFVDKPEIVAPSFGIIFVALIFGFLMRKNIIGPVVGTLLSLAAIVGLIYLGHSFIIKLDQEIWLLIAFVYAFIASVLPVWILLQPRDYLSMYILIIGLFGGLIGILVGQPEINAPAFIESNAKNIPLFPMLFIIIACGALSGFHSIVSSGTSAKQLNYERDGKFISYGSMLTEALLALLVVTMISSVLIWNPEFDGALSFHKLLKESPILTFGAALGKTVESLGVPYNVGLAFGTLMLNAFILTTLDTASRLARYIMQETVGVRVGGVFNNKFFAVSVSLGAGGFFAFSHSYGAIWPLFGSANQLIGTMALFVVSTYFVTMKKPKLYTLIPAIIMLIITESSLVYQVGWQFFPESKWVLTIVSIVLFILGLAIAYESVNKIRRLTKETARR